MLNPYQLENSPQFSKIMELLSEYADANRIQHEAQVNRPTLPPHFRARYTDLTNALTIKSRVCRAMRAIQSDLTISSMQDPTFVRAFERDIVISICRTLFEDLGEAYSNLQPLIDDLETYLAQR